MHFCPHCHQELKPAPGRSWTCQDCDYQTFNPKKPPHPVVELILTLGAIVLGSFFGGLGGFWLNCWLGEGQFLFSTIGQILGYGSIFLICVAVGGLLGLKLALGQRVNPRWGAAGGPIVRAVMTMIGGVFFAAIAAAILYVIIDAAGQSRVDFANVAIQASLGSIVLLAAAYGAIVGFTRVH